TADWHCAGRNPQKMTPMTGTAVAEPPNALSDASRLMWRSATPGSIVAPAGSRRVAEETAIAFSYQGASYAVMMATPADLEDFAVGFTLNEGIAASPGDIESVEVLTGE